MNEPMQEKRTALKFAPRRSDGEVERPQFGPGSAEAQRLGIAYELRRAGLGEDAIWGGAVDAVVSLMGAGVSTMDYAAAAVVRVLRPSTFRSECSCDFGHSELNAACPRNREAGR